MPSNSNPESGAAFFYIILAIILFGTLAFTISRGMRGQSTEALSARQMDLAASEILFQAQNISRAIDRVKQRGISENDICFNHAKISDVNRTAYALVTDCSNNKNKIFHPSGGGLSFENIPTKWLDSDLAGSQGYGEWMFSGGNAVLDIGTSPLTEARSVEMLAHLNHMKRDLCEAINKKLGIIGIPDNTNSFAPTTPFNGNFTATGQVNNASFSGEYSGCFQNNNTWASYIFYHVIIDR